MDKIIFPKDYLEESYFGTDSSELIFIDLMQCKPKQNLPQYTRRYNGRKDWQIIYIHDGYAYFNFNGKTEKLGPYALVVFKPSEPQIYAYMAEDCPCADFIHFSGTAIPALMEKYHLTERQYYNIIPANHSILLEAFSNLQTQFSLFRNQDYMCWGEFINILAKLSISIEENNSSQNTKYLKYNNSIAKVLKKMHESYTSNQSVEYYASLVNLSPSRFAHIFKEITGSSPISYRNMLRLENSKKMLLQSPASIEEIAIQNGYDNISIFSKSFKKKYGCTPSNYRASHISTTHT